MDLKEKLNKEVLETNWPPLVDHFARGAVYLVDRELDLVEVGLTMADDDVSRIKSYLDDGLMYPPTPEEATSFSEDESLFFNMLIIEPYVLIQRKIND